MGRKLVGVPFAIGGLMLWAYAAAAMPAGTVIGVSGSCTDHGRVLNRGDAVQIISDYFPRISEIHLKDTYAKYRGNKETPTQEMHKQASVYHNLGGGGVDFVGVFDVLRKKHFKGWAVFDIDAPRAGDGTGSVDDNIAASVNYMRSALGVKLPPANGKTGLFKA